MKIILERPIISEKSQNLKEKLNVYSFKVSSFANKKQIAKAVEEFFGVKPSKITTFTIKGKRLPLNKWRKKNYLADWKKAYVTIPKGESIKELE